MPKLKIAQSSLPLDRQAPDFAGRIEDVAHAISYLQTQKDAGDAAFAVCGVDRRLATLDDLRRVVERVRYWELTGNPAPKLNTVAASGANEPALTAETARNEPDAATANNPHEMDGGAGSPAPSPAQVGSGTVIENQAGEYAPEADSPPEAADGAGLSPGGTDAAPSAAEAKPWAPYDYAARADQYSAYIIAKAERDEDHVPAEILKQRDKVARLSHAMLKLEQAKKSLKGMLDAAVEELDNQESSRAAAQNVPLPLIDSAVQQAAAESGQSNHPVPSCEATPSAPPAEPWRSEILADIGLPDGIVKKLAEHEPPIVTLGELTDWQTAKGDFWAKDIHGIGLAAAEKIGSVCEKYWAAHPQPEMAAG